MLGACVSLLMLSAAAPRVLAQEAGVSASGSTSAKQNQTPFGYGITESKKGVSKLVAIFTQINNTGVDAKTSNIGKITGLQEGERILGIDFRPATGELFGLGSSSRLYTINLSTAQATAVGGQFAIPLNGSFFGFDFNPTVDRIRVVSDADQNLRLNPISGGVVDSNLATDGVQGDGNLSFGNGTDPFIAGAGYTNSDTDATTGTTLYYIDSGQDALVISPTPNAGTLTTVGSLGVDVSVPISFDIALQNGVNAGIATFLSSSESKKLSVALIDLSTGAATIIGRVKSSDPLVGIALAPTIAPTT